MAALGETGHPAPLDFEVALADVDAALARGDIEGAQALANELRQRIGVDLGPAAEARVVLRLASCDFHMSRLQRAHDSAQQAALTFQRLALLSEEVEALSLCSRAASALGRSVEAVETALLATSLAKDLPTGLCTARACMSLGIAYGWGHRYAQAASAFDTAMQFANRFGNVAAQLEVETERHWVLAVRSVEERQGQETLNFFVSLAEIHEHLARCSLLGVAGALTPGAAAGLASSAALVCSLLALWSGDDEQADALLRRGTAPGGPRNSAAWLPVVESWVRAEMARRLQDYPAAGMHASRMTSWATQAGHGPLARIGYRLASDIYRLQGRNDQAYNELHQLLALERTMQARHLDSREGTVGHQVAARHSEHRIEALAVESSKFERWALEDALTGLANLRRFEQCLDEWSAVAADKGRPLCVAIIDADSFRHINNTFGHPIGDKVLRGIAAEMKAQVRETDLPARLGGDEFAILFRDTEEQVAEQVARRLEQAVREHDWTGLSQNLRVSISIGVVEAQPGETKKELVKRSDAVMYAKKQERHLAEVASTVPRAVVQRVAGWLRRAQRVALFVGAGKADGAVGSTFSANLSGWSPEARTRFGHVLGLQQSPDMYRGIWREWRRANRELQQTPTDVNVVALSRLLQQATIVTERVDGLLAKAGAVDVIELYGNAFRDRCGGCGRVHANTDSSRCLACNAPGRVIRPDVVLLGEYPDSTLLASAELTLTRADLVLVVDCDATTLPGAGLLKKAKARAAKVVMIGTGSRTRSEIADVSIPLDSAVVLKVLKEALEKASPADVAVSGLTPPGFEVLCFMTGQGNDDRGTSLDRAVEWSNWEIEHRLRTFAWMFPLLTQSNVNPGGPIPTRADFALLAADEGARHGMRRAFMRMLRFYGFEWKDGKVERASGWMEGFATWALTHSHHDLFISRILGALTLFGLKDEAAAFLRTLETELQQHRAGDTREPVAFWRLAVQG